jgi:hypothetical protein
VAERVTGNIGGMEVLETATSEVSDALGVPVGTVETLCLLMIQTTSGWRELLLTDDDLEALLVDLPIFLKRLRVAKADSEWGEGRGLWGILPRPTTRQA